MNIKLGSVWPCKLDKGYSFIYTPDAAKATAILGINNAYNQGKLEEQLKLLYKIKFRTETH